MPEIKKAGCSKISWQGREAYALENDLVRLVMLASGGHVAAFHFPEAAVRPALNPLWTPPWKTIDHDRYDERRHRARYGPAETGKLLCGISGHNLCLDYFGPPSAEEAQQGLAIHGEAPNSRWRIEECCADSRESLLRASVGLTVAGLRFEREIRLRRGEPVAYFRETVTNQRNADHFFHWTQHVTLGPPFLNLRDSRIAISATRGRTFPHGYEGHELLKSGRDFHWPLAPRAAGKTADLTLPFQRPGLGFLAAVLMNPARDWQFIAAINRHHGLVAGYCFNRADFPWTAIWEENKSRAAAPWRNRCQARGLEFGSTPFPLERRESFSNGPLFGTPHFSLVPARGQKTVRYLSFLACVPPNFGNVEDVRISKSAIRIKGSARGAAAVLSASRAGES